MTDHPNLAAALVAALAHLSVVDKGRKANAGSYTYDYAALEDVVKDTRPVLAEHGVVALTPLGDGPSVTVVLLHASGERMDFGPLPFPLGRDAQATGSMVTYMRRYALLAALGMAAGDDDDGASASPREVKSEPRNLNTAAPNSSLGKLTVEQVEQVDAWLAADPTRKAELKAKFGTLQPARIDAGRWAEVEQVIGGGGQRITSSAKDSGDAVASGSGPAPTTEYSDEPF